MHWYSPYAAIAASSFPGSIRRILVGVALNVIDGMSSVKTYINVENKASRTCWCWLFAVRRYSRTYLLHFIQTFSVLIMEKQCSNSFNLGSPLREFSCIQVLIIRFYLPCASPHVIGPTHMFGKTNQRYILMVENREIKAPTHLMPAAVGKWNQGLMVSTVGGRSFTGTLCE